MIDETTGASPDETTTPPAGGDEGAAAATPETTTTPDAGTADAPAGAAPSPEQPSADSGSADTPAGTADTPEDAEPIDEPADGDEPEPQPTALGGEQVVKAVEDAQARGYFGEKVDPQPNEVHTLPAQTDGEQTAVEGSDAQ